MKKVIVSIVLCICMLSLLVGCLDSGHKYQFDFTDGTSKELTINDLAANETKYEGTMKTITGTGVVKTVRKSLGGSYSVYGGSIPYAYEWQITLEEGITIEAMIGYDVKGSEYDLVGSSSFSQPGAASTQGNYAINVKAGDMIQFSLPLTDEGTYIWSGEEPSLHIELEGLEKVNPREPLQVQSLGIQVL